MHWSSLGPLSCLHSISLGLLGTERNMTVGCILTELSLTAWTLLVGRILKSLGWSSCCSSSKVGSSVVILNVLSGPHGLSELQRLHLPFGHLGPSSLNWFVFNCSCLWLTLRLLLALKSLSLTVLLLQLGLLRVNQPVGLGVEDLPLLDEDVLADLYVFLIGSLIELTTTLRTFLQVSFLSLVRLLTSIAFLLWTMSLVSESLSIDLFALNCWWYLIFNTYWLLLLFWLKGLTKILILWLSLLLLLLNRLLILSRWDSLNWLSLFLPLFIHSCLRLLYPGRLSLYYLLLLLLYPLLQQVQIPSSIDNIPLCVVLYGYFNFFHVWLPGWHRMNLFFNAPPSHLNLLSSLLWRGLLVSHHVTQLRLRLLLNGMLPLQILLSMNLRITLWCCGQVKVTFLRLMIHRKRSLLGVLSRVVLSVLRQCGLVDLSFGQLLSLPIRVVTSLLSLPLIVDICWYSLHWSELLLILICIHFI